MNKKIYLAPATSVVNVHLSQVLASSPVGSQVYTDIDATNGAEGLTKQQEWGDIWE